MLAFFFRDAKQSQAIKVVDKFGYVAAATTVGECWDGYSDQKAYNWLAAATVLKVSSSSTADVLTSGTGAWTIRISGLDANYLEVDEDVNMNGTTLVTTTTAFLRVFRVRVLTAGTGLVNAGDIYIHNNTVGTPTAGVPDDATKTYAKVLATNGQTLMTIYTVPANMVGRISTASWQSGATSGTAKDSTLSIFTRENATANAAWNIKGRSAGFSNAGDFDGMEYLEIPAKTDIKGTVVSSGAAGVSINFTMSLHEV